jgi:hypothetical protein
LYEVILTILGAISGQQTRVTETVCFAETDLGPISHVVPLLESFPRIYVQSSKRRRADMKALHDSLSPSSGTARRGKIGY